MVSDDVIKTLRIPGDLNDRLHELAQANERTDAAEIRVAITRHLEASAGEPTPGHPVKA